MPAQQNVNPIVSLKNDILSKIQTAIDPSKDKDGTVLAEVSEKTGQLLKDCGVTVTQLRKVFTEVKRLSPDDENYKIQIESFESKACIHSRKVSKNKRFPGDS